MQTTGELKAEQEEAVDNRIRRPAPTSTGTYVLAGLVTLLLLTVAQEIFTNSNFGWPVVAEYFFSRLILQGLMMTVTLTVIVMAIGTLAGLLVAVLRMSRNKFISGTAWAYINFFRGTPLLIQVIFWYNIAALFPSVSLGIPFGPSILDLDTNSLITPFSAAVIALTLNEAAYMAEIIRSGFLGVDRGQYEAAEAVGMTPRGVLAIVIPQAIRIIIPPTANQLITTFKNTALVSIIGLADLLHTAQIIYANNYQTIPLLITASLWFLIITSVLGYFQGLVERHYSKGFSPRSKKRAVK